MLCFEGQSCDHNELADIMARHVTKTDVAAWAGIIRQAEQDGVLAHALQAAAAMGIEIAPERALDLATYGESFAGTEHINGTR